MKHYGDITKINGANVEPVWILCGGSPCQDLSVAGLRKGLAGERSGLFMEQIRIVKEMRENDKANGRTGKLVRCRWMVWENVQGAFSSGTPKGEDFRIVLEEIAKIADESAVIPGPPNGKWTPSGCILGNGWSIAWLLHDAQYHGTPQRRRRICVCVLTSTENPHQEYYLNCGEKPLTPNPTKLSQILEWGSNTEKYKLSPKACQGILNRAERRGKELPKILKEALIRQASPLRSGGEERSIVTEEKPEKEL